MWPLSLDWTQTDTGTQSVLLPPLSQLQVGTTTVLRDPQEQEKEETEIIRGTQ